MDLAFTTKKDRLSLLHLIHRRIRAHCTLRLRLYCQGAGARPGGFAGAGAAGVLEVDALSVAFFNEYFHHQGEVGGFGFCGDCLVAM